MSKKVAQNTIDFKKDEINKAVKDALTNLNTKMQGATRQLNEQIQTELNTIVTNLSKEIETKVNEIKSLIPVAPAQQAADDKIKDRLKGGEADNVSEDKVNKKQLDMGQKVEMEHTDDSEIAREIARDHLAEELRKGKEKEDQTYYNDLRKMHKDSVCNLPGVVKESKKKKKSKHSLEPMMDHPTPRDGEHNKDLPDFWRRNFDYGESPYMNIGFIEKITDKPPYKKKKKKKSQMSRELVSMADKLDKVGLTDAANKIDNMVKIAIMQSHIIKALKGNDQGEIERALSNFIQNLHHGSTPEQEFRMTDDEYRQFVEAIRTGRLGIARRLFGIEVDDDSLGEVRLLSGKKYKFTGATKNVGGRGPAAAATVRQIERISDGQLGGWIEDERNLSHSGSCFIFDGIVWENAEVSGNVIVDGKYTPLIYNNAKIYGNVVVDGFNDSIEIGGYAKIYGSAVVRGGYVNDNAEIYDNAFIKDQSSISGNAKVYGDAMVTIQGEVMENAEVFGNAKIIDGKVKGNAKVNWDVLNGDVEG